MGPALGFSEVNFCSGIGIRFLAIFNERVKILMKKRPTY